MGVFRIEGVNQEGRSMVLGTAAEVLNNLRDALGEHSRAWITDELDEDVSVADLIRAAKDEQNA